MEINNANPNKLHNEFINAGIVPVSVKNDSKIDEYIAEHTWIIFAEGTDMVIVQQIIDAHDPTPLPLPKTDAEKIADLEAENMMNMLALAELHLMILNVGGGA